MSYVTSFPPSGSPTPCAPSGAYGGNVMQTGLAINGGPAKVFSFIENLSSQLPLFISFGLPVSATQYHVVLSPSGIFTDPGMIKVPIFVSGGSFLAWSM